MLVKFALTDADVEKCFPVISQLLSSLSSSDELIKRVKDQTHSDRYYLVYLEDKELIKCVADFRILDNLKERVLYICFFVTDKKARSQGYGSFLLKWLLDYAELRQCDSITLTTNVQNTHAHRFYFQHGMHISSFGFRKYCGR